MLRVVRCAPNISQNRCAGLVAVLFRSKVFRRDLVVKKVHISTEDRMYPGDVEEEFNKWANTASPHAAIVDLASGKQPEQGYKHCTNLTELADWYGFVLLENASQRATFLFFGANRFRRGDGSR